MTTRRHVFVAHIAVPLVCTIGGMFAATQYVAAAFSYSPQLGRPLAVVGSQPIYWPWGWLFWPLRFEASAPAIFSSAQWIMSAAVAVAFALSIALAVIRHRYGTTSDAHGSARWASTREIRRAGFGENTGVVLCQSGDARFAAKPTAEGIQWKMTKLGRLVTHSGPEHVFCFAPTRSGKGAGIVIPTLLSWTGSAVVYDIKKELWSSTAGWRRTFSRCWRFEPTSAGSIRFNPLMEIRRGDNEVRDVQNVADILIDPDGSRERRDHWQQTGHALLVGAILHVLYAEENKSLAGVAQFLADPSRTLNETLNRMMRCRHLETGTHPVVASAAREMLSKSENELSGVFSTAMAALGLYRDPLIARNTSVSDFRIADLMNSDAPVTLYLVVPPSDISRTRALVRLLLNQIGRGLTESMTFGTTKSYRHRLLFLLDEFPSLGRLDFLETQLAYLAGYGIKCLLIAQSLNQIEKAYGPNNSILDNSHIRVTYGALDERTARRISDLLGQATIAKRQLSFSGGRMGPWLGNVSHSEQEVGRALLTAGEILQLPGDDALLLAGGLPPYRAKKVMYYQDPRFKERAWLPPPDSEEEQAAELLAQDAPPPWADVVQQAEPPKDVMSPEDPKDMELGLSDVEVEPVGLAPLTLDAGSLEDDSTAVPTTRLPL